MSAVKLQTENESFSSFHYMVFFLFRAGMGFLMFSFVDAFRDSETAKKVVRLIEEMASDGRKYRIVHVCGTHEDAITKYGVRGMLPSNVGVSWAPAAKCLPPVSSTVSKMLRTPRSYAYP